MSLGNSLGPPVRFSRQLPTPVKQAIYDMDIAPMPTDSANEQAEEAEFEEEGEQWKDEEGDEAVRLAREASMRAQAKSDVSERTLVTSDTCLTLFFCVNSERNAENPLLLLVFFLTHPPKASTKLLPPRPNTACALASTQSSLVGTWATSAMKTPVRRLLPLSAGSRRNSRR